MPTAEILGDRAERRRGTVSRRQFLGAGAFLAGGLAWEGLPFALSAVGEGGAPLERHDLVVVGGGLAGLRFAHQMWTTRRIASVVYEASSRLGGRVWSDRGKLIPGVVLEHGGEFIGSDHSSMLGLAAGFGLDLEAVPSPDPPRLWLDGTEYEASQFHADLAELQPALDEARKLAGPLTTADLHTLAGARLDAMSAAEWLGRNCPGGSRGRLARVLSTTLLAEFGHEPVAQSALNLIYRFGREPGSGAEPRVDARYRVRGGNDLIVNAMARQLPQDSIRLGMRLESVARRWDGSYACTFRAEGSGMREVIARHVVLALPFRQLRAVDRSRAGFSARKTAAIERFALGSNARVAHPFTSRVWENAGNSGGAATGDPFHFQEIWEGAAGASGGGVLMNLLGGMQGGIVSSLTEDGSAHGVARPELTDRFLDLVATEGGTSVGPIRGLRAPYAGRSWVDQWAKDPLVGGSYSCYGIEDRVTFGGSEHVREGNVHFCGEQTSIGFKGSMEGAVRSAERLVAGWPRL